MPASFGLVSFLISNKLPERKLYKYLGVFSSSAPVAALATYFFVVSRIRKNRIVLFSEPAILPLFTVIDSLLDALLCWDLFVRGNYSRLPRTSKIPSNLKGHLHFKRTKAIDLIPSFKV